MMSEEDQLQKEWRDIVIKKLDSLDNDLKEVAAKAAKAPVEYSQLEAVSADVSSIRDSVSTLTSSVTKLRPSIMKEVRENFTSKDQFEPVKKIVYGGVAVVLIAVLSAAIALLIN
jgi:septation ring formation regulator EzrA|tara:strand:- start:1718 stop:2062 length:345 start_codon:yes stop_codon:yes gene_type:complete